MATRLERAAEIFRAMSHPRGETLVRLAQNNPDLARQIDEAVAAFEATGSQRPLISLLSATTGLTDPQAVRMATASAPATRGPMPFDERVASDPNINKAVSAVGMQDMPAAQKLDAYRQLAEAGGADNLMDRLASYTGRPEYSLDLLPNNRPLFSADAGLGGGGSSMDVMPGAGIPSSPGTGLIPSGPRGLSAGGGGGLIVPPGRGLTTTGGDLSVQGMESPAPRGLPAPNQPRIEGPGQRRIEGPREPDVPARRPDIEDPEVPPRGRRAPEPQAPSRSNARRAAAAAGAGIATGALGVRLAVEPGRLGDSEAGGMSTADLAAETSPPPSVMTEEPAPLSPRDQAQELIRKLNLMRREAGGEVPEAPAMQREINRLMAMSNQTLAAASRGEVATGGSDYHMQAARLTAQLNDMRRRAGGEVPQARQMMAEIARLQRLGDEQRNARQAPRRAG